MRFAPFLASFAVTLATSISAMAQIDPSSALLLKSNGTAVRDSGIDSGRYTVRPKSDTRRDSPRAVRSETEPSPTPTPTPVPAATPAPQAQPQSTSISPPKLSGPQAAAQAAAAPQVPAPQQPTATPQASDSREEKRMTLMELSIAPGYLYNSSASSYGYRNYDVSAPTIAAEGRVWVGRSLAVQAGYLGTMSASVSDSLDGSRAVATPQQWFTAGIKTRSLFGASRLAPSLSASIDYYEYEFRAPGDSLLRAKLKTTGVRFAVDADVPSTPYRSWTLGVSIAPKLQHRESSTGVDFQSGSGVDANQVGLSLGTNIRFDSESVVFVKLSHFVEKDLFSGSATLADPVNGQTPTGVSVTNSFTLFQLGYTWGN